MGLAICRQQSARIAHRRLRLPGGKNSRGDLAVFYREIACAAHGSGAIFGSDRGGLFYKTPHRAIALLARKRQKLLILRLAGGQRQRRIDGGAQGIFIDAIGGYARGAPFGDRSDGNGYAMLRNILMNGVVGKTGEVVENFFDMDFCFFRARRFRKSQNIVNDSMQTTLAG